MKGILFAFLFCILLSSCENQQVTKINLTNDAFSKISFTHDLRKLKKETKLYCSYKSDEVQVKVSEKNYGYNLKVKNKATIISRKKYEMHEVKDSSHFKSLAKLNVFQAIAGESGYIGIKSKFLNVEFGGEKQLYFFQEGFDKYIVEGNKNREGILFTFDNNAKIHFTPKGLQGKNIDINKRIQDWYDGKLATACLFDVKKVSGYLALFDAFYGGETQNLDFAFYLNPVSNLIEVFCKKGNAYAKEELLNKILTDNLILSKISKHKSEYSLNKKLIESIKNHKVGKYAGELSWSISENKEHTQSKDNCYPNYDFSSFFNLEGDKLTIDGKEIEINSPVIIPSGYVVEIKNQSKINLIQGAFILSYSPVELKNSFIESSDSTGRGFHVINANALSSIDSVIFSNLKNLDFLTWKLPSAVTFYESPVKIYNSQFLGANCEDALNIFRADYHLESSIIQNTFSDAFDADFSNGIIKNCKIIDSGNDGVDVSGSHVEIIDCEFIRIADKAISAGENSTIDVKNALIKGASLGVVAKDLSKVNIESSKITESEVVFCAFQKKKEFGPSKINASEITYDLYKEENLIEKGSSLKIDGKKVHNYRDDVRKYLYGNEYGKKTVK
ncbi:MAG: hypothetical protein CMP67_04380 [Flavobacteriales bacterium]|nr:hypothetical protein [Flavobacteriales bacterium]